MVTTAALSVSSSLFLPPLAAAAGNSRPKPGNARNPTKRRNGSLKARPFPPARRSSSSFPDASEATSYTRLPLKDDFSSLDTSTGSSSRTSVSEIKLFESPVPGLDSAKKKKSSSRNSSSKRERSAKDSVLHEIDEVEEKIVSYELDDDDEEFSSVGNRLYKAKIPAAVIAKKQLPSGSIKGSGKNTKSPISVEEIEEEEEQYEDEFLDYRSEDEEVIVGCGSNDLYEEDSDLVLDSEKLDEEMDAFLDEDEDLKGGEMKEKGVPAIMRCFDRAKIYVKAGDGGNGVVAFRREKFVPFGGPSGGDGGRGGNVYVVVDGAMNSLLPFRKSVHFRAERGGHGHGMKQAGAKGEDVIVKVAPGTVIREAGKEGFRGEVLLEMMRPGQRALILPGGRGGRGNAAFKSGTNKVPKIAENGEKGPEMWLDLELKLVADVGIVGAPNAGKSTLLSAISAAQPAIANYPFTTLLPNLGVVSLDFDATMVVADLPGLLEGAHRGFGLGHEFLRHSERCSILVHVVDGSGLQPEYEFDAVRLELELFSPELSEKPYIVVYNKMDLPEAYERWNTFKGHMQDCGIQSFCISAMNRQGTGDVVFAAYVHLKKEREAKKELEEWSKDLNLNHVADAIQKQRRASMNEFEIIHDSGTNTWHVSGAGIQRFVQMTNWQYSESLRRFQHVLEACGVNKHLIKRGVKEGDIVVVGEMEMVWNNEPENNRSLSTRKRTIGSVRWPPPLK